MIGVDQDRLGAAVGGLQFGDLEGAGDLGGVAEIETPEIPEEVAAVDAAIRRVVERVSEPAWTDAEARANRARVLAGGLAHREFTTADVWAELGPGFPVTKGIAGRMLAAKGAGLIENTGRTTYPPKDAPGPNNGQRLTVWRAL